MFAMIHSYFNMKNISLQVKTIYNAYDIKRNNILL